MKKILVIRFSSIGDIVLTTPVVRVLKKQLKETEIHFAIKYRYRYLLQENPYIDRFHFLKDDLSGLIRQLKKERFDYVVDLHNNLRTRIIKLALGVKAFSFNKLNIEKWLKVNLKIDLLPPVHIVDRYLATVARLGVKNDRQGLDFFISSKDWVPIDSLPTSHRSGYIAYAVGGQHNTKRLPVEKMIELCDKINRPIVLLGGKEDVEDGEQVKRFFATDGDATGYKKFLTLQKNTMIENTCGRYNLHQSASLAYQADAVFAHDTGMMHIAAALKKHVFSIWGNTVPAFGMYPYATRFTVLENPLPRCRPCSKIGFDKCPKKHFDCMKKIAFNFSLPDEQ